jgi:hypothetical protein
LRGRNGLGLARDGRDLVAHRHHLALRAAGPAAPGPQILRLTLLEFVVRRQLAQNQELLVGLIENNPKKGIANPTTERLLKAFDDITLTIVHSPGQLIRHVTPLTALQTRILHLLGLSPGVYTQLAEN